MAKKKKTARRRKNPVDQHAARELELYLDNDADLYRQRVTPAIKNMVGKAARGEFDPEKAVTLWGYVVKAAADKYKREFGGPTFDKPTRDQVARLFAQHYAKAIKAGEFDDYVPKSRKKTWPAMKKKIRAPRVRRSNPTNAAWNELRQAEAALEEAGIRVRTASRSVKRAKAEWDDPSRSERRPPEHELKARGRRTVNPTKKKKKTRRSNPAVRDTKPSETFKVQEADGTNVVWRGGGAIKRAGELTIVLQHYRKDGSGYWRRFSRPSKRHKVYRYDGSGQGTFK